MTETKWTPGPWFWHRNELLHERHKMGSYTLIGSMDQDETGNSWEVDHANANLIAAAPDLYEALGELRKWQMPCGADPEIDAALAAADAALAKARGEQ